MRFLAIYICPINLKTRFMKRLFTITVLTIAAIVTYAQHTEIPVNHYGKIAGDMIFKPECSPWLATKVDVINEDFGTWPPAGWEFVDGSQSVGNQHWHLEGTGDTYASVQYDNGDGVAHNQDEWMISPEFTVPVNAFLTFMYHSNPYWMVDPNENADMMVKISTDGVNWTELWDENNTGFEYSVWTEEFIDLSAYEGQNVQIAFQYLGFDACWFYIDKLRVYGLPEFDIEITDARINFFEIFDYHADGSDFHYSSHYQRIPMEIVQDNEYAYLAFNTMVINKGYGSAVVQCNVRVTDPDGVEVYNMNSANDLVIGEMGIDTIDIAYDEGTEFLLENPVLGIYTVEYTVFIDGKSVKISGDKEILTKTLTFEIDNSVFARDDNNADGYIGPQFWVGGGTDGDILTVRYPFFADSHITSVSAYIHPDTDPGNSLLCNVYQYDQGAGDYVAISTAPLRTIEESDLGTWINFTFPDPAYVITDPEYALTPILIGFEFYYTAEDSYLWLGCDKTVPSSSWGTLWYMQGGSNANEWYAINNFEGVPMIRINLFNETKAGNESILSKIHVYPNPATTSVVIDNVEGCRIVLTDNLGRSVESFESSLNSLTIDLSKYQPGNYFVKVINKVSEVEVKRFSIVR